MTSAPAAGETAATSSRRGRPPTSCPIPRSPTANALREPGKVERPRRESPTRFLELTGARAHNLKDVTFRVPVERMVVVAGVSGSGKSTLVRKVFFPALRRALGLVAEEPGAFDRLRAVEPAGVKGRRGQLAGVGRATAVDQSPIGRTPRSVPATFLGIWDEIRRLFAAFPSRRCGALRRVASRSTRRAAAAARRARGRGSSCRRWRFFPTSSPPATRAPARDSSLRRCDVRYAGHTIGDVLHLSAEDAAQLFAAHPKIARPLQTMCDLGVGYVQIGQGSNTLSGGEAQRLKLAAELTAGVAHEPTLYVLDEPTTGLHLGDVRRLITVLDRLVQRGDTLVVIEHHPDVIASADSVVELGPEAGDRGGRVVFEGSPDRLFRAKTATGTFFAQTGRRG